MNFVGNYLWELKLPLFYLEGIDSKKFLHGQTTADIIGLKEGENLRSCWLSPVGRLKALLEIRIINNNLSFLVLLGNTEEVIDGLQNVIFPSDKVKIVISKKIRRLQEISLNKSWKEDKVEWILDDQELPLKFSNHKIADQKMIKEWKILQGIPTSSYEINGKNNPLELGLINFINFDKGCYLGQETLSKVRNLGKLKCQLKFVSFEKSLIEGESLWLGSENQKENVGIVTSAIDSANSRSIGLALIRRKFISSKELKLVQPCGVIKIKDPIGFD